MTQHLVAQAAATSKTGSCPLVRDTKAAAHSTGVTHRAATLTRNPAVTANGAAASSPPLYRPDAPRSCL